jgi:hypothetical protein
VEAGTYIHVGRSGYSIKATAVSPTKDFSRLHSSAYLVASFQRGKIHRRNKERKRGAKRKFGELKTTVRASQDYRIFPHTIKSIQVEGSFSEEKDWVLEKSLLANTDNSFFAIPNVIFSSTNPFVPVLNPIDKPRYVKKGEVIGVIADPQSYFDSPRSLEHLAKMQEAATKTAMFIQVLMERDPQCSAYLAKTQEIVEQGKTPHLEPKPPDADDEQWGPKTDCHDK